MNVGVTGSIPVGAVDKRGRSYKMFNMGKTSENLKNRLEKVAENKKSIASKIPVIKQFISDIVEIFTAIFEAVEEIEERLEELESRTSGARYKRID